MQEQLDGSNKYESEDAKSPRQDNGVWADTRWEWDSGDVEPESCDRDGRDGVDDDDPCGKAAWLDCTATSELDQENEGEDRSGRRTGQRPSDGVRDMKEVQKRGNQGQSSDQKPTFNVETHEAEMPIGELASKRTPEGDDHRGETDEGQREAGEAKKVVGICRCHDRILTSMCLRDIEETRATLPVQADASNMYGEHRSADARQTVVSALDECPAAVAKTDTWADASSKRTDKDCCRRPVWPNVRRQPREQTQLASVGCTPKVDGITLPQSPSVNGSISHVRRKRLPLAGSGQDGAQKHSKSKRCDDDRHDDSKCDGAQRTHPRHELAAPKVTPHQCVVRGDATRNGRNDDYPSQYTRNPRQEVAHQTTSTNNEGAHQYDYGNELFQSYTFESLIAADRQHIDLPRRRSATVVSDAV